MAEEVRPESNGLPIWSIQKPTWERDWDPTRLLMMQGNFPRRSFASGSPEGEQVATLDLNDAFWQRTTWKKANQVPQNVWHTRSCG